MSFAEKRLIIIISLTQQLKQSVNDFGRTLESPANQTRILNEQWERLTRAVGNVFLPIISKVLPYLNAILMVLTEIISAIATLFGYKAEDYDYFSGMADSVLDLEEGLDGATESAKALKQGLRGFDKLNVITTPSASSNTTGAGGISPDILNAYNSAYADYMQKLDNVQMKATKIRDAIMEWLGFTKEVDEETGEVSFKFDHITSGTVLGALGTGGTIFIGVTTILSALKKISGLTGLSDIFSGLGAALSGTVGTVLLVVGAIALLGYAIYDLYQNNEDFAKSFDEKWEGIKEALEPVKEAIGELWEVLKQFFNETLLPLGEQVWEIIQTIAQVLLEILYPVFTDYIIPAIEFLITIVKDIFSVINDLWAEYGEPISEAIKEAITKVGDIFNKLWTQFIKPVVEKVMKILKDLWENTLKPMFKKIGEVIGELIEFILTLWNNVLAPLVGFLIDTLAPIFEAVFNFVADVVGTVVKIIGGIINGLLDILKGIIKFLTGVFKGDWKKALDGIVDILKGVVNIIISIVEGVVNGIITLINLAIKGLWNGIKAVINGITGIVSGIAGIFGIDLDLELTASAPQISLVSIPRLKTGIDFVPNDYYPAYLDYGERVLTEQENREYTAMKNEQDFGNKNMTSFNPTFIIQVGDEQVAKHVINNIENMAKANGKPFTIGG